MVRRPNPGVDGLRFWDGATWTEQVARPDIQAGPWPQEPQVQRTDRGQSVKVETLKMMGHVSLLILLAWWIVGQIIVHSVGTNVSKGELVLYLVLYTVQVALVMTSVFLWWRYLQERRR